MYQSRPVITAHVYHDLSLDQLLTVHVYHDLSLDQLLTVHVYHMCNDLAS